MPRPHRGMTPNPGPPGNPNSNPSSVSPIHVSNLLSHGLSRNSNPSPGSLIDFRISFLRGLSRNSNPSSVSLVDFRTFFYRGLSKARGTLTVCHDKQQTTSIGSRSVGACSMLLMSRLLPTAVPVSLVNFRIFFYRGLSKARGTLTVCRDKEQTTSIGSKSVGACPILLMSRLFPTAGNRCR